MLVNSRYMRAVRTDIYPSIFYKSGRITTVDALSLRLSALALNSLATVFGSVGVFCLYALAVSHKPKYAFYSALYVGLASMITLALSEKAEINKPRH
jgi:hypothetical protein